MKVTVKLFAAAKEIAGTQQIEIDLPDGSNLAQLRDRLAQSHPALVPLLTRSLFAVNRSYAANHVEIDSNAEIALIPPVSGG
jgi:molybdopterin converting factor subunit 1